MRVLIFLFAVAMALTLGTVCRQVFHAIKNPFKR